MDGRRNRSEMLLHTDQSLHVGINRPTGNNVLRWNAEIARREQQRLATQKAEQARQAQIKADLIAKEQAKFELNNSHAICYHKNNRS